MHGTLPRADPIAEVGRDIFANIGSSKPSAFDLNYWASILMRWSMAAPEFKVQLFRLIDVLPQLRSSAEIASHVREYLLSAVTTLPGLASGPAVNILKWGLRGDPNSLRAKLVAQQVKWSVENMAGLFIAGATPQDALGALRALRTKRLAFTIDLLGEFCVSEHEAVDYMNRYLDAIQVVGRACLTWPERGSIVPHHRGDTSPLCVSVKLTALYSQCGPLNMPRSIQVLAERLSMIVRRANEFGAQVYVDAEDSTNNPIIYSVFKQVFGSGEFKHLAYPGVVVQAYAKDARATINDLLHFAHSRGAPIAIRLVKGAYWDQETILAQQNGWISPLFAHKQSSDANFEILARLLLDNSELVLPGFGSHNVRSLASACTYAELGGISRDQFEIQVLYGMAEPIAQAFSDRGYLVRMYVPLGDLFVGMGYLVRRLLENTSNESFLRHTFFDKNKVGELLGAPTFHPDDLPSDIQPTLGTLHSEDSYVRERAIL